jgi:hypothetical protein
LRHKEEKSIEFPSFAECNTSYGVRDYLWITQMKQPPMLLTFPGSGTTMTQMLIEYSTGILSGSIYEEEELYSIMPGLQFCGQRLSLIKAHVKDILIKPAEDGHAEAVTFKTNQYVAKCRRGMIHSFDRFLIVLRSPWASAWSNFQRDFNSQVYMQAKEAAAAVAAAEAEAAAKGEESQAPPAAVTVAPRSHTGGIPLSEFNASNWRELAIRSPHYGVPTYNYMWGSLLPYLFNKYHYSRADDANYGNSTYFHQPSEAAARSVRRKEREDASREWEKSRDRENDKTGSAAQPPYRIDGNNNVLVVRYEDLLHAERRLHVLRKMIRFVGLPTTKDSTWALTKNPTEVELQQAQAERKRKFETSPAEEEERRLKCAFVLADNPLTHRKHHNKRVGASVAEGSASETLEAKAKAAAEVVDPEDETVRYSVAYQDSEMVCDMWRGLQNSTAELMRYGYYHGPHQQEIQPPSCK